MLDINIAQERFEIYKDKHQLLIDEDITEADTRSKLLDELFKEVLGWDEKDIDREGYTEEGYYDYQFSIPSFRFVVEAKKNFVDFTLPIKHRKVTIATLRKDNKAVISQIRNYLFEVGLQYGIISNGRQFIIGKFINSDGSDWRKNKCIIFNGISELDKHFIEFFNILSKFAVVENSGFKIFDEVQKGEIIFSSLKNRNSELIRNSLSSNLAPVIDNVFGEIYQYEVLDNEDLIEQCFIENQEIKKNKSDIEKLFADRPPKLTEVIPVRNTKNIASQIENEMDSIPISLKSLTPPKPIIIVGSKGAGKTTFIHYLFKLSFSDSFLDQRPYIHIDFRKYTNEDIEKISKVIINDAIDTLFDNYSKYKLHSKKVLKRVFRKEIKRNDESIWEYDKKHNIDKYEDKLNSFLEESRSDKEQYFIKISKYLIRERRYQFNQPMLHGIVSFLKNQVSEGCH